MGKEREWQTQDISAWRKSLNVSKKLYSKFNCTKAPQRSNKWFSELFWVLLYRISKCCAEAPDFTKAGRQTWLCCSPCRAHPRFSWTAPSYIFPLALHPWKWITETSAPTITGYSVVFSKGEEAQATASQPGFCSPPPVLIAQLQKEPTKHTIPPSALCSFPHPTQNVSLEIFWHAIENELGIKTEGSHGSKLG